MNPTPPAWFNKVPEVTLAFWIVKIMTTTVGETAADYLAVDVGLGTALTTGIMLLLLGASLAWQMTARRYVPVRYWIAVVLLSIVGTQITDILTDTLEVSLYLSTAVFASLLAALFAVWYAQEKTLSIKEVYPGRREALYWGAILLTFALGTAAGDLATEALGLGFRIGILVFGGSIACTACAFFLGANTALAFWIAYILTRPLGAALGDFLSQAKEYGGLGLGAMATSTFFLSIIAVLVAIAQHHAGLLRRSQSLRRS